MHGVRFGVVAFLALVQFAVSAQETGRSLARQLASPIGVPVLNNSDAYNFGQQPVQLSVGGRVFADSPAGGPD